MAFYDFINLTQVHNAQDIFTFGRLSLFTVSFTGIKQVVMQMMKHFVSSYCLVKLVMVQSFQPKGFALESM